MIQWIMRVSMLGAGKLHSSAVVIVMVMAGIMVTSDLLAIADMLFLGLMTVL